MNQILTLTLNPSVDHILTVDNLSIYSKNLVSSHLVFYGGKGINVAFALGKLNATGLAIALMGAGEEEAYARKLSEVGITFTGIPVPAKTRENYKVVDLSNGRDTEFNQRGFSITNNEMERINFHLEKTLPGACWLMLSGSLPPGAPTESYAGFINMAKQYGVLSCLDASGCALIEGVKAIPDMLRINLSELEELTGKKLVDESLIAIELASLHAAGIKYLSVSSGSRGVVAFDGNYCFKVIAPKLKPLSLTGAGDTMTAALVHHLSLGKGFQESVAFSTAVASASVLQNEPGDFCVEDVNRFLDEIKVEELDF